MYPAAMGMPRWCLIWFKEGFTVAIETLAKTGPLLGAACVAGRSQDTEVTVANAWWMQIHGEPLVSGGGFGVLGEPG